MGDDEELQQIRARRLAELQQQQGGPAGGRAGGAVNQQANAEAQKEKEEEMRNVILTQILSQEARARCEACSDQVAHHLIVCLSQ